MNINKNQIDIKKCALTAAKWGGAVSLFWLTVWLFKTEWATYLFTALFTGVPMNSYFYQINLDLIPRLGHALIDFAVVSFIAFLVAALMSNRRAVRAAAQPVTQ